MRHFEDLQWQRKMVQPMKGIKGGSSQYHIPYQAEPLSLLSDSKNFLKRHEIASSNLSELLQICLQGERSDSPASLS